LLYLFKPLHRIYAFFVIAQNLVDFEQLNAKCRMQIEKYKIGVEKTNFDFKPFIITVCQI